MNKQNHRIHLLVVVTVISATILACGSSTDSQSGSATEALQTAVAEFQLSLAETEASKVTPTNSPLPLPTDTPLPTSTSTPLPQPITFDGSGTSVVDLNKTDEAMIIHITGNSGSRYFGVTSYDSAGNYMDLLVNTTDPYDGVRPLDFFDNEHTSRLQIEATGPWHIELLPLLSARVVNVPGSITGKGDDVFIVKGTPDLAIIQGNSESRYFGVFGYSNGYDLLVNTTDPYNGTVILDRETYIMAVQSEGNWTIELTAP